MRWMHFTSAAGASYNRGTVQSLKQDKENGQRLHPAMASSFGPVKMIRVFGFR